MKEKTMCMRCRKTFDTSNPKTYEGCLYDLDLGVICGRCLYHVVRYVINEEGDYI